MIGELIALVGAVLVLLSAVGVNRFRDTLARLHALAKASTLGVLLLLGGAALSLSSVDDLTSVVLAALLHLLASPPGSNMVSRAAYLAEGLPAGAIDEWTEETGAIPGAPGAGVGAAPHAPQQRDGVAGPPEPGAGDLR